MMTTIQQIEQLPAFKDSNGNLFVNAVPKSLLEEIAKGLEQLQEMRETIDEMEGKNVVDLKQMAKILQVSQHTINTWRRPEVDLLKEGVHFVYRGGRVKYIVKAMQNFSFDKAMAEKIATEKESVEAHLDFLKKKESKIRKRKKL